MRGASRSSVKQWTGSLTSPSKILEQLFFIVMTSLTTHTRVLN